MFTLPVFSQHHQISAIIAFFVDDAWTCPGANAGPWSVCAGPLGGFLAVYGKVPFFFYILHFFLIHLLSILWFGLTAGAWNL